MKNPNNGIKKETDSLKVKNEIKKNKIQNIIINYYYNLFKNLIIQIKLKYNYK